MARTSARPAAENARTTDRGGRPTSDQSDTDGTNDGGSDATRGDERVDSGPWLADRGSLPVRRVFDVLLVVVLVLVVVPFVVYAAPSLVGAEESYIVRSGSMAPAIETGDVVIVERATPAEIETGDVITFVPDGQPPPTTHRVVSKTEADGVTRFTTKGDANDQPDAEPVVENELVGEVTLVLPYVGYVVSFASTSAGFFALVAAPFGLLLATEVWSLFRGGDDGDGPDDADDARGSPAPDPAPEADAPDEATYTLSPTDIRLSLAVLLVLTAYSSFVAVSRPTPWSIAVAVAAFGTAVYLAAMRYTAATAGTTAPERPTAPLPPAREVPSAEGDRRGLDPVTAGDGPGANGTLGVSLAVSSATRPPNGPGPTGDEVVREGSETERSEAVTVDPGPAGGPAGSDEDRDAGTADEPSGDEPSGGEPSERPTDGAEGPDQEGADASASEKPGARRRIRAPFAAVGGAAYRFLYRVGRLEVALVRAVLRRVGLRSDGGES
jgi:signal peptidase